MRCAATDLDGPSGVVVLDNLRMGKNAIANRKRIVNFRILLAIFIDGYLCDPDNTRALECAGFVCCRQDALEEQEKQH